MKTLMPAVTAGMLVLAGLAAAVAAAPNPPVPEDKTYVDGDNAWFDYWGEYRVWVPWVSSFAVSPDDVAEWNPGVRLMERLRPGLAVGGKSVSLHVEGDLFYGTLWGDYPTLGSDGTRFAPASVVDSRSFQPRKFYLNWRSPIGVFRFGHQLSNWGMGLISNGGEERPEEMLSQREGGDTVERLVFVTTPAAMFTKDAWANKLRLALGADLVYLDDNASLLDGDLALQYFGSLMWQEPTWNLGLFVIYRDQTDDNGDTLEVTVFDLYGALDIPLGTSKLALRSGVEAALITGHTTRNRPWNSPDGVDILAFGLAGDLGILITKADLGVGVKFGYLSGDSDLDDGDLYRFRADPNFNVGLIMYDYYLAGMSAASIDRAQDPEHAAVPPGGLSGVATNGALENTWYLAPTITYGDMKGAAAQLLVLAAWSASPVASPYESFAAGGQPRGYRGANSSENNYLGTEIDLAVRYRGRIAGVVTIEVRGEGAILFPGSAFSNAAGEEPGQVIALGGRLSCEW